jgi:hypothetical protein
VKYRDERGSGIAGDGGCEQVGAGGGTGGEGGVDVVGEFGAGDRVHGVCLFS